MTASVYFYSRKQHGFDNAMKICNVKIIDIFSKVNCFL